MTEPNATVFVVDDDPSIQRALKSLIRSVGLQAEVVGSVEAFLKSQRPDAPGCLVLDVRLPGVSGLAFQKQLAESGHPLPVIFITGHGDIPMSVRAMQAGAVDFLPKPFRDQDLLDAIHKALQRDQALRHERAETAELRRRYDSLTPSETRLLPLVVAGRLNKQIAALMGISENTVKVHRSNMMQKMRANSVVELVRIADKLHIRAAAPDR